MRAIAAAGVLLLLPPLLYAQPFGFVRESLQFKLADLHFAFTGIYYFDNPGPAAVEKAVYYPHVLSGSPPDSTKIAEVRSGEIVPGAPGPSGFTFTARLAARTTQAYRISFVQRARERSLEYILRTTAEWGEPLDRVTILIRVPSDITLRSISIEPTSVTSTDDGTTYVIDREKFMPGRNLILKWDRK